MLYSANNTQPVLQIGQTVYILDLHKGSVTGRLASRRKFVDSDREYYQVELDSESNAPLYVTEDGVMVKDPHVLPESQATGCVQICSNVPIFGTVIHPIQHIYNVGDIIAFNLGGDSIWRFGMVLIYKVNVNSIYVTVTYDNSTHADVNHEIVDIETTMPLSWYKELFLKENL